jgi:hypothetical protein
MFPDQVAIGQAPLGFQVSSSELFGTGTFTTISPEIQAFMDLELALFASVGGRVCLFGCVAGDTTLVDFADELELFSLNRNNDGQLRVLGIIEVLPLSEGFLNNSLILEVSLPDIETTGSGSPPPPITAQGTDDFLGLDLNIVNAAAAALGLPPLSDTIDLGPLTITYNLLSAGVGADLGPSQMFSLLPSVLIQLDVLETGQRVTFRGGQSSPNLFFPPGIQPGQFVTVKPTYFMDSEFHNLTQVLLSGLLFASGGEFHISALGLPGIGFGPLFDETLPLGTLPIDVFDQTFTLDAYDSFMGQPFQVQVIGIGPRQVPGPATLMLLASGLAALALSVRRWRAADRRTRCAETMLRISLNVGQRGL